VVDVGEGDTLRGSFALDRLVPSLDTVVVAARTLPTALAEFEERRKFGQGQFMTRAEIEKLNRVEVTDLLRLFKSVGPNGANFRAGCAFQFFIDGVRLRAPRPDDLPRPAELEGIEVYANSATIPLQYKTFGGDRPNSPGGGFCGVILLWTRHGP
jgi:hypothetical protein